jgi:hypothetical protein
VGLCTAGVEEDARRKRESLLGARHHENVVAAARDATLAERPGDGLAERRPAERMGRLREGTEPARDRRPERTLQRSYG